MSFQKVFSLIIVYEWLQNHIGPSLTIEVVPKVKIEKVYQVRSVIFMFIHSKGILSFKWDSTKSLYWFPSKN